MFQNDLLTVWWGT